MEIAQTYVLCLIDEYGVGVWNIETVFYYGCAEQQVIFPLHESKYLVFKHLCLHLTVGHAYPHIRNQPVEYVVYAIQFLNPVVQEEYLSVAVQFVIDYAAYLFLVEEYDFGLNGNPVRRGSVYYGKVPGSQERELEGSRNRSGSKGQGVDRLLQLTELFLGTYSELLLLIYYQQAQILELECGIQKFVGAYDYVYAAFFESFLYVGYFFCAAQPAHVFHIAREVLQTGTEGVVVLQAEYGCRYENGNLLAVRNGLEGSPYGNFRLSESYVSADQTVHRTSVLHIPLCSSNRLFLIRSVLIHK